MMFHFAAEGTITLQTRMAALGSSNCIHLRSSEARKPLVSSSNGFNMWTTWPHQFYTFSDYLCSQVRWLKQTTAFSCRLILTLQAPGSPSHGLSMQARQRGLPWNNAQYQTIPLYTIVALFCYQALSFALESKKDQESAIICYNIMPAAF